MTISLHVCLLGRRVGDFRPRPETPEAPLEILERLRPSWPGAPKSVCVLRACFGTTVCSLDPAGPNDRWARFSPGPAAPSNLLSAPPWPGGEDPLRSSGSSPPGHGGADGGVVRGLGQAVAVCNGDCPLLCLWQGEQLAVLHAGYRCLMRQRPGEPSIVESALAAGFDPEQTRAGIGGGVGPCCWVPGYATKAEILDPSRSAEQDLLSRCLTRTTRSPQGPGHVSVDLYALAHALLTRAGVPDAQIDWDARCTCCARAEGRPLCWSRTRWKQEGGVEGRNCTLAWLIDGVAPLPLSWTCPF